MTAHLTTCTFAVAFCCLLMPGISRAENPGDYELTVAVAKTALAGWELYGAKEFAAAFDGGHYTDADPQTRCRDFWSNGRYAKLDRDNNGHHETIFVVRQGELIYAGSLGGRGVFVDVARAYEKYDGQPAAALLAERQLR